MACRKSAVDILKDFLLGDQSTVRSNYRKKPVKMNA